MDWVVREVEFGWKTSETEEMHPPRTLWSEGSDVSHVPGDGVPADQADPARKEAWLGTAGCLRRRTASSAHPAPWD